MSVSYIHELSSLVKQSHQIIGSMKQLAAKSGELTSEDYECFLKYKNDLTPILSKLARVDPNIVAKIRKRQNKRRREKERRLERRRWKEGAKEREKEMDEWMREKRREDEMKEKEQTNKRILADQLSTLDKQLALLSGLETLASARGAVIEPATPRLIARLKQLRAEMERAGEMGGDMMREYLFNGDSGSGDVGPGTLLEIRNDWDQFVSAEATATSIPVGWVTPSTFCEHCQSNDPVLGSE